jgi:hypothetical protein
MRHNAIRCMCRGRGRRSLIVVKKPRIVVYSLVQCRPEIHQTTVVSECTLVTVTTQAHNTAFFNDYGVAQRGLVAFLCTGMVRTQVGWIVHIKSLFNLVRKPVYLKERHRYTVLSFSVEFNVQRKPRKSTCWRYAVLYKG